ncbi:FkbM family methyltransferase [Tropicibacter sp. Alg240-R139]|uniref:FkbM family methyltransferase n=1 Tax=Tropicibacter sp. Alg240-R139 TaxID=2305991 RepID=UPI001F077897|nr:FkbM family methyltransferase [Tropicibacter sp. Alg240-R139]
MTDTQTVAAECLGVKVPMTRFLHEKRIERIKAARYEGQEIEGSLHVVTPDDTVLEIGAGIGLVGAVIAHNAKPKAIHSFEANPELLDAINELYILNNLQDLISVNNQVLISAEDRPESLQFHIRTSYLGSSLLNPGNRPSNVVDVPTASFATVCDALEPTVLVMDIEGGELELLRHADLSCFRGVVLEFHPEAYGVEGMRECKTILTDAGFERVDEKSTRTVWTCVRPEG